LKIDPFPENDQPLFSEYTTSIPEIVVFVKGIATDGSDLFFCNLANLQEEEGDKRHSLVQIRAHFLLLHKGVALVSLFFVCIESNYRKIYR